MQHKPGSSAEEGKAGLLLQACSSLHILITLYSLHTGVLHMLQTCWAKCTQIYVSFTSPSVIFNVFASGMLNKNCTHLQDAVLDFNVQEMVFARVWRSGQGRRLSLCRHARGGRPYTSTTSRLLISQHIGQTRQHWFGRERQSLAALLDRVQHLQDLGVPEPFQLPNAASQNFCDCLLPLRFVQLLGTSLLEQEHRHLLQEKGRCLTLHRPQ